MDKKQQKSIKKCGKCEKLKRIYGRGLCAACYYRELRAEKNAKKGSTGSTETEVKQRTRAIADAMIGQDIPPIPEPTIDIPVPGLVMYAPVQPDPPEAGDVVEELPAEDLGYPFPDQPPELTVTVDFSRFPELYQHLVTTAEEQDRTVEGQARWMIRTALAGRD